MRPRCDVGEAVAEAVVAVGDRHALLRGHALAQPPSDLVDRRQLAGLRVLPLRRPPLQLALDVALALGEVAEPDLVDVDGVQVGEHVDEVLAQPRPQLERQLGRRVLGAVEHDAVDEAHHVERRAVDRLVGAQPERRRHRHGGRADGGDDPVLAGHVVGRGQHMAERWAAQHEPCAVGIGDRERQVRPTAGDQRELERRQRHRRCWPRASGLTRSMSMPVHERATTVTRDAQPGSADADDLAPVDRGHLTTSPVRGAWIIEPPPM